MSTLQAFEGYVPFFQTLVWPVVVIIAIIMLKEQIRDLFKAVELRISEGSPVKIGAVELGQQKIITKTEDLGRQVEIFGNPDHMKLLFKAKGSNWTKSTKALETPSGCVVQTTTERQNTDGSWTSTEALAFVPGVAVLKDEQGDGRHLGMPNSAPKKDN